MLDTNKTTCALLQLEPITGLKQQIRVHTAEGLKCPILGDHKFSSDSHEPQVINLKNNGGGMEGVGVAQLLAVPREEP